MMGVSRIVRAMAAIFLAVTLSACSATYQNHGYIPPQDALDAIIIGADTRETLKTSIGAPGTSGLLTDGAWYYTQSRFRHFAYREPEEIDRQVVAISFDDKGVVSNVERFGLERGRVIVLSRRVTEANVKGIGFLQQLFGSFGRVDVSNLL